MNEALQKSFKELGIGEAKATSIWYGYNTNLDDTHTVARKSNTDIVLVNKVTEVFSAFSKVGKGVKGGLCNRGQCQSPKDVVFFNKGTDKYYCCGCSVRINDACTPHELEGLFGEGTKYLCTTDDGLGPYEWERKQFEEVEG